MKKRPEKRRFKPLMPSLREKKRYLAFEILSEKPLPGSVAVRELLQGMQGFLGTYGMAAAGVRLVPGLWQEKTQRGILRHGHAHISMIKAALALIRAIDQQPVLVRTLTVSGMIGKAKAVMQHERG